MLFLIVEDHPEVAENNCIFLKQLYPDAICTLAENPGQAKERLKLEIPDLIVVDLQYGLISGVNSPKEGLNFMEFLCLQHPNLNILVYTSEPNLLKSCLNLINKHHGGFAVVNKIERRKSFLEGIKIALNGEFKIPRELRDEVILDDKESEIIKYLCQENLTDKAITSKMNLSLKTVQNYIQRLKHKLNIEVDDKNYNSRVALCMEAVKRKLINL
jgi:DNA-binding NarL/FixJ family response regulator